MMYANLRTVVLAWKGYRSEIEAAAALGVAPNTLGNWVDGTHLPPSTRLPSLATALGIPESDLRALVARERLARTKMAKRAAGVVGRRGHGQVSCAEPTRVPARRPGQVAK